VSGKNLCWSCSNKIDSCFLWFIEPLHSGQVPYERVDKIIFGDFWLFLVRNMLFRVQKGFNTKYFNKILIGKNAKNYNICMEKSSKFYKTASIKIRITFFAK
jgi:hypothetical protein